MNAAYRDLGLVRPGPAELELSTDENSAGICDDEEFGDITGLQPVRICLNDFHHLGRLPGDGYLSWPGQRRAPPFSGFRERPTIDCHLFLGELPKFNGTAADGPHLNGVVSISPSVEYLERAYDDAKYGEPSRRPYLEVSIPSVTDSEMAGTGGHAVSILAQYAPYHLKEGTWDSARRDALGDSVIRTLSEYAPNVESAVLQRHVMTPLDLEETYGLTEGNVYHGEITLDQMFFMRPVPGFARYRSPVEGLYMCGAGTHPGGGVTGVPGYNAAREIVKDYATAPGSDR